MDKMTTGVSNKSLFAEERQRKIIETINANGKAVVPVLCEMFGVSSSTIRNDLKQLEGKKLITRTHGGAIRNSKMGRELSPTDKETQMMPQKKAIARAALELIDDGDIIAVTTGTTTFKNFPKVTRPEWTWCARTCFVRWPFAPTPSISFNS